MRRDMKSWIGPRWKRSRINFYYRCYRFKYIHTCINNIDTLSDEWESEDDTGGVISRSNLRLDCDRLGILKFILLFGEGGLAINEIPLLYPRIIEKQVTKFHGKKFIQNDQPDAMGLLVFTNESMALKFWATLAATCIQAYPSTIRICPDPSGWRIYSEALSLSFQYELLNDESIKNNTTPTSATGSIEDEQDTTPLSLDLLSVLTTTPTNSSTVNTVATTTPTPVQTIVQQKHNQKKLNYICSFIAQQQDANQVAKTLSTIGVKCMYHKPSKIMSLQFPDDKVYQSISFCHKVYTTPTGSRVQCCFIKCNGKALPIIKRTNIEHISNSMEKNNTIKIINLNHQILAL